ncbi:hypothetical protein ACFWUW_21855 [Streptomyces sp. NPDC058655]|uniref:hypothetical protein n=1 Tax=unclassified Streptomyces TaxID=2593676 RepID=UPI003646E666
MTGVAATPDGAPETLLRAALAEPGRLPELLAGFALRHAGPRAAREVARLRAERPRAAASALSEVVAARGMRRTVSEGAFVGGPFLVLMPVAFCAALLSQARTVLELAAVAGHDPTAPQRAAELLVLQGVYADTDAAAKALAARKGDRRGAEPQVAARPVRWWSALTAVTVRMARLLGLTAPRQETTHARWARLARTGQWVLLGVVLLVGMVVPLVWLPYMAVSYRRSTGRALSRAAAFYRTEVPQSLRGRAAPRLDPGTLAAALRALLSLLLPLCLLLLVHVTDLRIAGRTWPVLGIALFAGSVAAGGVWQWRRHRRRGRTG